MKTRIESYKNYGKTMFIEDGDITLGVTLDVGPRVIYMSIDGCENLFFEDIDRETKRTDAEFEDTFGKDTAWYIYGGHRIWMSPEEYPLTYNPDNSPIEYEISDNTVTFTQLPYKGGLVSAELKLVFENGGVTVHNTVKNITDKALNGAVWALSVMAKDGVGFVKLNDKDMGLLPNKKLVIWSYTSLTDERLHLLDKYLAVKQDRFAKSDFKIATDCDSGTVYYYKDGVLFTKEFDIENDAVYPDGDVYCEFFTGKNFFELESLSALHDIAPGEKLTHIERWNLRKCDTLTEISDENLEKLLKITK
ncbi:MAG: hypothetical protein IKL21_03255 [Clostridia bacterium]|nr:hypothetical protein [Clostridia bacterium]